MSSRKADSDLRRIRTILASLSRKGFLEILWHLDSLGRAAYYNDIRRFALDNKVIESRASVTVILSRLTKMGMLERRVITESSPLRTTYSISKKGKTILQYLEQIGDEVK